MDVERLGIHDFLLDGLQRRDHRVFVSGGLLAGPSIESLEIGRRVLGDVARRRLLQMGEHQTEHFHGDGQFVFCTEKIGIVFFPGFSWQIRREDAFRQRGIDQAQERYLFALALQFGGHVHGDRAAQ